MRKYQVNACFINILMALRKAVLNEDDFWHEHCNVFQSNRSWWHLFGQLAGIKSGGSWRTLSELESH